MGTKFHKKSLFLHAKYSTEYERLTLMRRTLYIFAGILLLGFFLVPGEVSACAMHAGQEKESVKKESVEKEKSCCKKSQEESPAEQDNAPSADDQSKETSPKDCCKGHKTHKGESGCSGNCDARSCHTPQTCCAHPVVEDVYNVFEKKDKNSYPVYTQPCYSAGFHSIWQPPKIA